MSASVAFGNERSCCAGLPVRLWWVVVDLRGETGLADTFLALTRGVAGAVSSTMLQFEGE
jgi:hypothetical protein